MEELYTIHPGEILKEEFLEQYGITAYRLAKETRLPLTRVTAITGVRPNITLTGDNPQKNSSARSQACYGTTSIHLPLLPSGPGGVQRPTLA